MYKCDNCDYKSGRIWCINRHSLNRHGLNQPTQHGVAAEGTSSTTPNKHLIKAAESAHSWKNACENLQQEKCADESWIKRCTDVGPITHWPYWTNVWSISDVGPIAHWPNWTNGSDVSSYNRNWRHKIFLSVFELLVLNLPKSVYLSILCSHHFT